jgi:hypothetical protein
MTPQMKFIEYILEIYEPNSNLDVWAEFVSLSPFMAINVGDFLNPTFFPKVRLLNYILRVVKIEHLIWNTPGDMKHKIMIFTEAIPREAKNESSPLL